MKLKRSNLFLITTAVWVLFAALSWFQINPFNVLNIIGFGALLIIPGLLTDLSLHLGRVLSFWQRLGQVIGFSILEILLWILLCNTLLPHLHVPRPLDRRPLLMELSLLYAIIVRWSWPGLKKLSYVISRKQLWKSQTDIAVLAVPPLFVALAITGATSLNNGGSDVLTLTMLIGVSGYLALLLALRKRLHDNTVGWAIYMISLSLLLMTSLRGWYTTGHDIQHEFEVFQLAQRNGVWNVSQLHDPYNACLSITILPTVFANLLRISAPYIYKVLFQLIFAAVPVLIYRLMRRYLSSAKSLLAVVYFIAFPTFFTDMPFLNRQEMAFLFLSLMLLVVYDVRIAAHKRRWLFVAFGLGMVLSHYSTTYSLLLILGCVVCLRPLYSLVARRAHHWKMFRRSSVEILDGYRINAAPTITVAMVVMLVYLCFLWNTVITSTSSAATSVISQTFNSIANGFSDDARSSDVSYSLFSPAGSTPTQELQAYQKQVVDPLRRSQPSSAFLPESAVAKSSTPVVATSTARLTTLGHKLADKGLNVGSFNYILKQLSAKLLQVFVIIGLLYAFFRKRFNRPIEAEYVLLTLASLIFVLLQVVLPDLSEAYGLLRAFQQSLMLLGLFLVIGTFALTAWVKPRWLRNGLPALMAVIFFLASTGVFSQLLGGYQPQLHLNNSGQYYDDYYTHEQEIAGAQWLNGVAATAPKDAPVELQTDQFTAGELFTYTNLRPVNDIYPGLVLRDSYVFLGYTTATKRQASIFFNGDLVTYTYPTQLLNQQKNLVYSNGGTEIYR